MMSNKRNQKAMSLLIMIIYFSVFLLVLEFAFYGFFESIFHRVNYEKRKQTARDLMEMGQVYADNMEKKGYTPEAFPKKNLKIDEVRDGRTFKRYTYKSPSLIKGGYFSLEYYYFQGSPVKVISTGHFEGIQYSSLIK